MVSLSHWGRSKRGTRLTFLFCCRKRGNLVACPSVRLGRSSLCWVWKTCRNLATTMESRNDEGERYFGWGHCGFLVRLGFRCQGSSQSNLSAELPLFSPLRQRIDREVGNSLRGRAMKVLRVNWRTKRTTTQRTLLDTKAVFSGACVSFSND